MLPFWLLILGTAASPDAVHTITKGTALYHSCQAEVRLMDLASLSQAKQPDLVDGSFCVGFVNGFTGNLGANTITCTHGASVATVVRAYVTFMASNPQLLEEDRRVGLRMALQNAFPCAASQGSSSKQPSNRDSRMT